MDFSVTRDGGDEIVVYDRQSGLPCVIGLCGKPGSLFEARLSEGRKPWWFTGSPFGAHIVGEAWKRHAELSAKRK